MGPQKNNAVERRAFSKVDLAQAWDVSLGAVDALLREGELVGFRVGRRVLIPVEAVEAYEQRHATNG